MLRGRAGVRQIFPELHRGIRVPADVSLLCTDDDLAFSRCEPPIACIAWDSQPVVRRVVRWVENVTRGKPDFRLTRTPAKLILGGTIGPAKRT